MKTYFTKNVELASLATELNALDKQGYSLVDIQFIDKICTEYYYLIIAYKEQPNPDIVAPKYDKIQEIGF